MFVGYVQVRTVMESRFNRTRELCIASRLVDDKRCCFLLVTLKLRLYGQQKAPSMVLANVVVVDMPKIEI